MFGVDFRIDHGNQDILARCNLLRLRALQFGQNVLRRVAVRAGGNLGGLFLQRENVVRLHAGDDAFAAQRADRVGHRTAAAKAPAIEARPEQRKTLRIELRQFVPPRDLIDRLRRRARRKRGNDFVGNEILIALLRRPAAAVVAVTRRCCRRPTGTTAAATAADISAAATDNRRTSRLATHPGREAGRQLCRRQDAALPFRRRDAPSSARRPSSTVPPKPPMPNAAAACDPAIQQAVRSRPPNNSARISRELIALLPHGKLPMWRRTITRSRR